MRLGRPQARPGQAAGRDLIDEVVPVTGAVHCYVDHVRQRQHCALAWSAHHGDDRGAARRGWPR
jgi:hypothetical protein